MKVPFANNLQPYFLFITALISNQVRKYRGIFKYLKKINFENAYLNIHIRAAFFIILLLTPLICLLFARGFEPWVKFQMFYLMVTLATTVLIAPKISKIPVFRKHLLWVDPLNQGQQRALGKLDLIELYKVSELNSNSASLRPYLARLVILGLIINFFNLFIPERSPISAIPLAISTYLCFQVLLIFLATNHRKEG